jgi:hypothetical protein
MQFEFKDSPIAQFMYSRSNSTSTSNSTSPSPSRGDRREVEVELEVEFEVEFEVEVEVEFELERDYMNWAMGELVNWKPAGERASGRKCAARGRGPERGFPAFVAWER